MNLAKKLSPSWIALLIFLAAFLFLPFRESMSLSKMAGDVGDNRLNNYFLENIYLFLAGRSDSLWHLRFYSPFPFVLGFSDNLFGSAPVYLLARAMTGQSDTAFQVWYLFGFFANFWAAYYSLRRLGNTVIASVVGALVFSFTLPVTAQSGHAQLHYRFGVPLSVVAFLFFLDRKNWWELVAAGGWLVWQFYCGIYIGFFTLLLLAALVAVYCIRAFRSGKSARAAELHQFLSQWRSQSPTGRRQVMGSLVALLLLVALLFYPYFRVSQLYGASRSFEEIASMLPRPQSYFLSDGSWLWSSHSKIFAEIPMRHEHQIFIGLVPLLLAVAGLLVGSSKRNGPAFPLLSGSLLSLMVVTLHLGGASLWYFFAKLPLASAIRAMVRIELVFLFPAAYLAALAVDYLTARSSVWSRICLFLAIPALILECAATRMSMSEKAAWRERDSLVESVFPKDLPPNPIVFFAQPNADWITSELDFMWAALRHGVRTMNGYSGLGPPSYSMRYGSDCSEVPRRAFSYLSFSGRSGDPQAYVDLMKRIVPVGFVGCEKEWLEKPPLSINDRTYSAEEIREISYRYLGRKREAGQWVVDVGILNGGNRPIAALSSSGRPVRVGWRFLDANGSPAGGWDHRKELPLDIPPGEALTIRIPVDPEIECKGGNLQVSLVQEMVYWAHDLGVKPLTVPWD